MRHCARLIAALPLMPVFLLALETALPNRRLAGSSRFMDENIPLLARATGNSAVDFIICESHITFVEVIERIRKRQVLLH